MGDPDPYPWVFERQISHPDPRRFFPTDHPEPRVKNPWVNEYPQVFELTDPHGYSQVYLQVPASRSDDAELGLQALIELTSY